MSDNVDIDNFPFEELPSGWELCSLGEIGEYINGRGFKKSEWTDYGLRIIRIQDLTGTGKEKNYFAGEIEGRHVVNSGDFLISWAATLGAYIWAGEKGALNQHIFKVASKIEKKFHFYLIKSILESLYRETHGSGMVHITKSKFASVPVLVPPLNEQTRIVSEIEKQFSRLDEAVANLKRAKAKLKRYKAAVLKAAVEGNLTEEWRKQHPNVEPADKLLVRNLAERRKAAGKGKYKEPVGPDAVKLPELPAGWVWASAEQLTGFITKGTTPSAGKLHYGIGEVRFLKVYNLTFTGNLNYNYKPAFVDSSVHLGELARSKVLCGDVLINIVGPPLGQVSIVPAEISQANINQAIARFRPLAGITNQFLATALMTKSIMSWAIKRAKTTAGQSNLTLELCRVLPIPLPPLAEQHQVVAEVERRLSIVAGAEAQVDTNLRRADRLRQSILKQAFSGQLVPQNPDDEPAIVLLERIRANASIKGGRIQDSPLRKPRQSVESKPAESDNASLDAVLTAILSLMQPGREYARADLADPLGLSTGRWNAAIREMKRIGKVRQEGEKRGARYVRI